MKKQTYFLLIIAFFLLIQWAKAQQVDLQAVSIGPTSNVPIAINQIQTVEVIMKNNGPGAIPTGQALFTATINTTFLRFDTPLTFTDASGLWVLTSSTANTLQVANSGGPLPGNAAAGYSIRFNVRGNATGSGDLNLASSLSPTATVSDRDGTNQSASGSIIVTAAMPVSLVNFTAQPRENRTVDLAWSTSLETNNKGFLIERSKDLSQFEKVGEVSDVATNSSALKTYRMTDQMPFSGTSYYRLTQTDLSGQSRVYPAISVVLRSDAYGVYPNPVVSDQRFMLRLDEPETAKVNFFSADGRTLSLQKAGIESGNLLLKTTGKLSTGVYLLTVEERGQTRQHRLVVE